MKFCRIGGGMQKTGGWKSGRVEGSETTASRTLVDGCGAGGDGVVACAGRSPPRLHYFDGSRPRSADFDVLFAEQSTFYTVAMYLQLSPASIMYIAGVLHTPST